MLVPSIQQHELALDIHMSPPSWTSLSPSTPSHPSRLSHSTGLSSRPHTANSHWLSILHMVIYIVYVSRLLCQFVPPSPCPTVSTVCSRERSYWWTDFQVSKRKFVFEKGIASFTLRCKTQIFKFYPICHALESRESGQNKAIYMSYASQVVLVVKNLPANAGDMRHRFNPWVREIPWRRA